MNSDLQGMNATNVESAISKLDSNIDRIGEIFSSLKEIEDAIQNEIPHEMNQEITEKFSQFQDQYKNILNGLNSYSTDLKTAKNNITTYVSIERKS